MKRRVFYVTNGSSEWTIFGTLARAQAYVAEQGNYQREDSPSVYVWFYANPADLDDQWTIYMVAVR